MKSDLVLYKKEGEIALITINRPEVYNALNHALLKGLEEFIEKIKVDSEIGIIILTGAGEKAFVSGADINEIATLDTLSGWQTSRDHQSVLNQLERLGKPSIAAINGYCLGGG